MSLKKYLEETTRETISSEIGFYTPLATHIFGRLLGYPAAQRLINKRGEHGIPDIRLRSKEDDSEWVTVEAKIDDMEIREESRRDRVWREQIRKHGYIRPETFYVVLCAPRTFYVCDLEGNTLEAVHMDEGRLTDPRSGESLPLTDKAFRERFHLVSYAGSLDRRQFQAFRQGELKSGHIPLSAETLPQLQSVFQYAISKLKEYARFQFRELRREFEEARDEIARIDKKLVDVGSGATRTREKLFYRQKTIRAQHRVAFQLFEEDYDRFRHDQTYGGTQEAEHFEDIFCTNTGYVALSRLIFVRICEDCGLTTRKLSNSGVAIWREFVENIKEQYQDLLEVAFKDVRHVYLSLFEPTVFDWFGRGDGKLHDILERILYRLNAFSFKEINRDLLGTMYQSFRPRVEKRRLGEYYTPDDVVDFILHQVGLASDPQLMQKTILDPACGSFTFGVRALAPLLQAGAELSPKNKIELVRIGLRGQDINPFSAFLSHLSLLFGLLDVYMQAKRVDPNFELQSFDIRNINSLTHGIPLRGEHAVGEEIADAERIEPADYVVGNPPFVRNERIPEGDRAVLNDIYGELQAGNTDLASYFLYAAPKYWLKRGGNLGMVAPLSVANARMAAALRLFLNKLEVTAIVSLEWLRLRREIFYGIDIVPMLIFARNAPAQPGHKVTVIRGLERREDLRRFIRDSEFAQKHSSSIPFERWYSLSPTRDWPVEITGEDVPILEKLGHAEKLSNAAKSSYGIKLGAGTRATDSFDVGRISPKCLPFLKGQNVCSFYHDEDTQELLYLDRLTSASDRSLWSDRELEFFGRNAGKFDEEGTGRKDLKHSGLEGLNGPSDVRCCAIPGVYRTLSACWFCPSQHAVHDSARVIVPTRFSGPVTAAIINSRLSRYYAFLLLRSAVVQRAHCTLFPRTLDHLPLPGLNARSAKKVHKHAMEAFELSTRAAMSVTDIYREGLGNAEAKTTKAGFLGLHLAEGLSEIDHDEIAPGDDPQMARDFKLFESADPDVELLARVALLASDADEFSAENVEDILLPADARARKELAEKLRNYSANLKKTQARVFGVMEDIDEIMAEGLGITPAEHETIRKRCQEFPLSITVERPRFAWNPERKRQPRRKYRPGERFK